MQAVYATFIKPYYAPCGLHMSSTRRYPFNITPIIISESSITHILFVIIMGATLCLMPYAVNTRPTNKADPHVTIDTPWALPEKTDTT